VIDVVGYEMEQVRTIDGQVTAVRGAVLDVAFEGATLPPIDHALIIKSDKGAPIIAEVQSDLDETTVRAIAL
jgi:F-type H+/Na+-transporting ATPase subunit beta